MKKSKFTESQIVFARKQSNSGVRVDEICRKIGISEATYSSWKKKYGGLSVSVAVTPSSEGGERKAQADGYGHKPGQADVAGRA
jgi:hypothetical protein